MTSTWDIFLSQWTILYSVRIEQENNVDDEFIEYVSTFSCLFSLQHLIHPFQGCQRYSWITKYEDGWGFMWSCCCFFISYYLS